LPKEIHLEALINFNFKKISPFLEAICLMLGLSLKKINTYDASF